MNKKLVAEKLEDIICEKLKDLGECMQDKIDCLHCMSHYSFEIFKSNQKIINENEPDKAGFITICPSCMSTNVDDKMDYDYSSDEEVIINETNYLQCENCGFNDLYL